MAARESELSRRLGRFGGGISRRHEEQVQCGHCGARNDGDRAVNGVICCWRCDRYTKVGK